MPFKHWQALHNLVGYQRGSVWPGQGCRGRGAGAFQVSSAGVAGEHRTRHD